MGQGKSTNSGKLAFNFEIFKNSFFSYLNIKRIIVIEVILLVPVIIPLFYVFQRISGNYNNWALSSEDAVVFFMNNIYIVYLYVLIPILVAIFTSISLGEEQKNHTIVYLLTRPVSRLWIILQKYMSLVPIGFLLSLPPVIINFLLYGAADPQFDFKTGLIDMWHLCVAVMLYVLLIIAIVLFFGTLSKRSIIFSVIYVLGYELSGYRLFVSLFDNIRYIFGSYYIHSYLAKTIAAVDTFPLRIASNFVDIWQAFLVIIIAIVVFLFGAYYVLNTKEYF